MIQPPPPPTPDSPADHDLDNTEPCEAFTFDDYTLEHIMDTYSPSYSINKTHIYHVSKHSSSHYGSLIDRGANGGLAGSDVRILERTGGTVSVTGIDNHELPGLDIVTCAVLLHTNHGKVMLYGVSPDISILLLYTFYQPVFYATHNQSYPSSSEERAARWVGFGEHVADALIHKLLDDDTKKILYRAAVRP